MPLSMTMVRNQIMVPNTAIELPGENYGNEGPAHESEFENSRPITEDCLYFASNVCAIHSGDVPPSDQISPILFLDKKLYSLATW